MIDTEYISQRKLSTATAAKPRILLDTPVFNRPRLFSSSAQNRQLRRLCDLVTIREVETEARRLKFRIPEFVARVSIPVLRREHARLITCPGERGLSVTDAKLRQFTGQLRASGFEAWLVTDDDDLRAATPYSWEPAEFVTRFLGLERCRSLLNYVPYAVDDLDRGCAT